MADSSPLSSGTEAGRPAKRRRTELSAFSQTHISVTKTFQNLSYIYINQQPGFLFIRKPGCFVKDKTRSKIDHFSYRYLTINKLILFKVPKTHQNRAKIC
jgi:hypothetical protein